jgi:hypothetical protein
MLFSRFSSRGAEVCAALAAADIVGGGGAH